MIRFRNLNYNEIHVYMQEQRVYLRNERVDIEGLVNFMKTHIQSKRYVFELFHNPD
jgi:hypothetical protein